MLLSSAKIDQMQIIPHFLGALWRIAVLVRGRVRPADFTFRTLLDWAVWSSCNLYCHFADTIPSSAQVHRYRPGFADKKDSLQSDTNERSSGGDGSLMIYRFQLLSLTYFGETGFQLQNKFLHVRQDIQKLYYLIPMLKENQYSWSSLMQKQVCTCLPP